MARPTALLPLVGLSCCVKPVNDHDSHIVVDKYVRAVSEGAECLPVLLPALGRGYDFDALLQRLDGLVLTGSRSDIEPHHYGTESEDPEALRDPDRDSTTLPLIRKALHAGVPVLAICRGIQELNVALGGSLHQKVHEESGRADHRSDKTQSLDEQFGPAHKVQLIAGGRLARLFGATEITVNSLHGQGIDRPSSHLAVEAIAPDGQIEAVHVIDAPAFAIGVQWHPEWRFRENRQSVALFRAFGDAARAHAAGATAASPKTTGNSAA